MNLFDSKRWAANLNHNNDQVFLARQQKTERILSGVCVALLVGTSAKFNLTSKKVTDRIYIELSMFLIMRLKNL